MTSAARGSVRAKPPGICKRQTIVIPDVWRVALRTGGNPPRRVWQRQDVASARPGAAYLVANAPVA